VGFRIQARLRFQKCEKLFFAIHVHKWSNRDQTPPYIAACLLQRPFRALLGMFLTEDRRCLERLKRALSRITCIHEPEGVVIFHHKGNVGFKKPIEKPRSGRVNRIHAHDRLLLLLLVSTQTYTCANTRPKSPPFSTYEGCADCAIDFF